jgi:DNA adenine methylase
MTAKRPIVRYHGGKWKLSQWILEYFPNHRVYVEPYGGGGSVLLRKIRSYAEVYNDLDGEIVNVFRVARDQGEQLRQLLYLTPFSREDFVQSYTPTDDPLEQARRTITRAFLGYGSAAASGKTTGFRANSNRSGTTPARDWKNYAEAFDTITARLRGVIIENRDALEVMAAHDSPQTLHYADPPYVAAARDAGKDYRHEMSDADHIALAEFLKELKGMVIVSGYPSELYNDLYQGWARIDKASMADNRSERTECLWLSPNVPSWRLI